MAIGHASPLAGQQSSVIAFMEDRIDCALSYQDGPEAYFKGKLEGETNADLLAIKIEFWSQTEYDARPNRVWG